MNNNNLQQLYGRVYVGALCLVPVIAMGAPRFTGLGPPLIALLGVAFYYYIHHRWPEFSKAPFFWAIAIPALMAVSALWGIAPATSFARAYKTLPVTLSGAVLWDLSRGLDAQAAVYFRRLFPRAVIVAGCICALELYDQGPLYHFIHAKPPAEDGDFNLSPINRSVVVFVLSVMPAFFCLRHGDYPKDKKNILFGALAIITGLVLFATSSQSAQLAFALGVIMYFGFPYSQKWAWMALTGILAALLFITPWMTQFLFHHIASETADFSFLGHSYANQRLEIWDFVSRRALEKPFFGHGADATRTIKNFDSAKLYWPTTQVLHPHNFAVQFWIEFGALGALIGSIFFGWVLNRIQTFEIPQQRVLLALFIASLSVAATGYGLWQAWWLGVFCLLFGYAALMAKAPSQK